MTKNIDLIKKCYTFVSTEPVLLPVRSAGRSFFILLINSLFKGGHLNDERS